MTIVAEDWAANSTSLLNCLLDVQPVITQKLSDTPLLVRGIPILEGTAILDDIPGIMVDGIP